MAYQIPNLKKMSRQYFMKKYPDKKQSQIPSYTSTGCFNEINI